MEIARRKGLDFSFSIEDIPSFHPNTVITTLTDRSGYEVTARGLSTGGGMFEIDEIDGEQVNISGEWHEILCISGQRECKVFEKLEKTFIRHQQPLHISVPPAPDGMLVNFKLSDPPDENVLDEIREIMDSEQGRVIYIPPILPVANGKNTEELFDTEKKLQAFLKDHPMELWEAAVEYEVRRSGWSKEQVMKYAINLIRVMSESITRGLEGNFNPSGFLEPSAGSIARAASENRLIPTGVIQDASIFSVAVMEYNAVMGKVVAGPTAGSCGVLPAVLFSLQRLYGYSQLELAKALMCAGLIGAFIASHATFSAEVCACQAENGSASSMAAAAVSHLVSSDLQVAIKSASLALQNMLGSICDPVAGGIEIPCISRNVLAATNALVSVNMVMGGFDPVIPLDQVIVAMREVGKLLPP
jgi:L-serine dehydratase